MNPAVAALFARHGPRYRWLAAATVMLGATSMILATTIVNVAIPDIMAAFAIGQARAQWLSTGFLAATTATMLASPWCLRAFGQRRTYLGALGVFIGVSVAGGLTGNDTLLIVSRILQGAAAGLIQPLAMIVLFQVFPPEQRGRAMGLYGLGVVLAPALGPALGGALVDLYSWRAVFFVTLPFCLAGAVLAPWFMIGREPGEPIPAFDWSGLLLFSVGLLALLDGLAKAPRLGWDAPAVWLRLGLGLALGAGFLVRERLAAQPMLDPVLFANRRFAAAAVVAFAYGAGIFGSVYLLPLFVQTIAGYSPTLSGLLLVPGGLVLAAVIPLAGRLSDRASASAVVMAGLGCFSLSFLLLLGSDAATGFWTLVAWTVVGRIGLGLVIPALNAGAIQALEPAQLHAGSGAVNFSRQLGGALGVNLLAVFVDWRSGLYPAANSDHPGVAAFHDGFLALALLFAAALLPAWLMRASAGGIR